MNKDSENLDNLFASKETFQKFLNRPEEIIEPDRAIQDLYKRATHDINTNYTAPEAILTVRGEIWGTLENFSAITGKAKSKKTFLLTAVIPALLTGRPILGHLVGKLPKNKERVLFVDTEQSPFHVQRVIERSLKMGKLNKKQVNSKLKVFSLRAFSIEERLHIIEHAVENEKNIGVIIIDGIKDLIYDINNMTDSSDIVNKLLYWSMWKKIHIIVVIHRNKTDNRVRGNIGTELMNKCESLLTVSQHNHNKDITTVEFELTRNISPNPFAFTIGSDSLPHPAKIPDKGGISTKRTEPDQVSREELIKVLNKAFNGIPYANQVQLMETFKEHFKVGSNKSRDFINYCIDKLELIQKSKGRHNSNIYQRL